MANKVALLEEELKKLQLQVLELQEKMQSQEKDRDKLEQQLAWHCSDDGCQDAFKKVCQRENKLIGEHCIELVADTERRSLSR